MVWRALPSRRQRGTDEDPAAAPPNGPANKTAGAPVGQRLVVDPPAARAAVPHDDGGLGAGISVGG